MKNVIALTALVCLAACSSTPSYVAKDIETQMDVRGTVDGSDVGLNKKKEIILQKEAAVDVALKVQEFKNYELEQKLANKLADLTQCRTEMADPRLGGTGEIVEIPEVDQMKQTGDIKEEIGLTEKGELKVVKREFFAVRLGIEEHYEEVLSSMLRQVTKFATSCNREYGYARVKNGLPASRFQTIGHFVGGGTWVVERRREENLDDAFRINSMYR